MTSTKYKATVFIPTWFGVEYVSKLLDAILAQELEDKYEVLVYDTSSTDGTWQVLEEYARRYNNIRIKSIAKKDFGHGRTRQQAAMEARGEYIVYLSQDALPASRKWLYEMIKPFEINNNVVAVLGKQRPRPDAFPLLKYEINAVFSAFGPDLGTTLFYNDYFSNEAASSDFISFYSDVNSAARKSSLLKIPYKDVEYAEDQLYGRDVIRAGLIKAYSPRGCVIHSNDIRLGDYAARMFDETAGLRRSGIAVEHPSLTVCTKLIVRGIASDSIRIIYDHDYSWPRKLYWLVINPLYHFEKWRGVRRGTRARFDDAILRSYSLEHRKQVKFDKSD